MFEKWEAIEKDDSVCHTYIRRIKSRNNAKFVSKNFDGVDVNHEEDDENDENVEEAIPSSAKMTLLLHGLQIGLEQKRFESFLESPRLCNLQYLKRGGGCFFKSHIFALVAGLSTKDPANKVGEKNNPATF